MEKEVNKNSEIKISIQLDRNKVPEKIQWQADDAEFDGMKEAKSLILSLWDKQDNVTL
jgi:hypothetical protein